MRMHDGEAHGIPDEENPEVTAEIAATMKPMADVIANHLRRGRGRQKAPTKRAVSIRLDADVLERYKRTGRGWQSRMNDDLKKAAKRLRAR